jgi:hypothetical protein
VFSDAVGLGTGNNCHVLTPAEFEKEPLLKSYLVGEETPYVMLKAMREEFIFTDVAFISIKGETSIGTKRHVHRYEYFECVISNVALCTPGLSATDLDGELTFHVNGVRHGMDIRKNEWDQIKPLYRTLIQLQRAQHQNQAALALQKDFLPKLWVTINDGSQLKAMAFDYATETFNRYNPISFKHVWENYGKNQNQN